MYRPRGSRNRRLRWRNNPSALSLAAEDTQAEMPTKAVRLEPSDTAGITRETSRSSSMTDFLKNQKFLNGE